MSTRPLIDEDQILPISLKVLITVTVAIVVSIIYVISNNITITNRLDGHDVKIQAIKDHQGETDAKQEKQKNVLNFLQILVMRIADKLNVDTSNPLDKADSLKNLNTSIYLPL